MQNTHLDGVWQSTGDVVNGDFVQFTRPVFTGSFRRPKFSHNETVQGLVTAESYGSKTGQHTFTIQSGAKFLRIKGRNLYRNITRLKWADETVRQGIADSKHMRGAVAKAGRLVAA